MKKYLIKKNEQREIILTQPGEYLVELAGAGAEAKIKGAFRTDVQEQLAVSVLVKHTAPHTRAETMLRGVAAGKSKITFRGKIVIEPDCGDTTSFLTERVLLLSESATAECIPDLEIETDDVRCSHAASVSRIPEEHIFYLMSRGIPQQKAEEIIIDGFLAEIS